MFKSSIYEALIFFIFLVFWYILVKTSRNAKLKQIDSNRKAIHTLIKKAYPLIFTTTKNIILLVFFICALFIFDLKDVKIASYFPVSLTALSLLLTTSNISNSLFTNDEIDPNNNIREIYLGRVLFTAMIWLSINIYSFCIPLLDLTFLPEHFQKLIVIIFLEIFCLGILLIFDLLVSTINIYSKNSLKEKPTHKKHDAYIKRQQVKKWHSSSRRK